MDRALINPLHHDGGVEDDSSNETQQKSAQRILRNFHVLAAALSLNHGCVTALVALAASELGSSLGNTTLFILYAFYTLSAAFLSNGLVAARRVAGRSSSAWSVLRLRRLVRRRLLHADRQRRHRRSGGPASRPAL